MNKLNIVFLHLLAICILPACASISVTDKAIPVTGADIPTEWLRDLPADKTAGNNWFDLYDDPLMLDYMQKAALENFDIKVSQTRIVAAEAELRRAMARLKPRFDASASASGAVLLSDFDAPFDSYGLNLSGRWDPDIFGQTRAIIEGSRANLRVQEALIADTRQAVIAATGLAYIRAVESALQVDLAKINLEFLTESRRIAEARYRLGDTAKSDFSFAEANYQSALASYESTLQSARAARRALSVLLGGYPEESLELATNLSTPKFLPSRDLPAVTLENRPDILAARAQLAGRIASFKVAKTARWPSLNITGSLSSGSAFADLFDPSAYVARLGTSLSQMIFDGGSAKAEIESAQVDIDISLLNYEQRLRRAMAEISDAYDRTETLTRTLLNLEASSTAANESLRLASIQFDLGESSLLDVLQVQSRVNNIDASLLRTKAALIEAVIAANEAVGNF